MKISDILSMSLVNLWRRKTRTFLTVLGVVIGTASIVVMLSLGIGLKQAMMAQVEMEGGLTEIMVDSEYDYGIEDLLLSDDTIRKFLELEHVDSVEPQISFSMPIQVGKYESYISVIGVSEEQLSKIELGSGQMPELGPTMQMIAGNQVLLNFYDYTTGEYPYWELDELPNVDLLNTSVIAGIETETEDVDGNGDGDSATGSEVFDSTFSTEPEDFSTDNEFGTTGTKDDDDDDDDSDFNDPFSGSMDDMSFDGYGSDSYSEFSSSTKRVQVKVTGMTEGDEKAYNAYSDNFYTSIEALSDFLKKNYSVNAIIPGQPTDRSGKPYRDLKYSRLVVNVDNSANVEEVLEIIQDMGYSADANKEWLEATEQQFMIIEAVLGGIGAVSLFVAAIGIANTMTMSTYERTKEIGIMKVLGCSLGNIRSMFLTEAAFIGLLGGIVGVALSFGLSMLVNYFAPSMLDMEFELAGDTAISTIPIWLVALSIVFSTVIGMAAGFFPAQRATRLSPLAAIRNE
ncbi:MAG: ABC transporter permease [Lachnospiraceae bacterium]|nr:ABC transporter permease [Lachnospiraceae bacterium]